MLSGGRVGIDVLHEVEPYTPNMTVSKGRGSCSDRLEHAPPELPLGGDGLLPLGPAHADAEQRRASQAEVGGVPDFIPGLTLAERFYREAVRPILDSRFPPSATAPP